MAKKLAKKPAPALALTPVYNRPPLDLRSPNGCTIQLLQATGILSRTFNTAEWAAWDKAICPLMGGPWLTPAYDAYTALKKLQENVPALLTLVQSDPRAEPAENPLWFATTKAPNYEPLGNNPVRELDPEFTREAATPLLAAIALVVSRVESGNWAVAPRGWTPRIIHANTPTSPAR